MAGHSKWSNIKRKKGAADQARAKVFTKLGREIQVAVKSGGPDPASNPRLKDVIAKAKSNNMPNDNINRSIAKASGADSADNYEEITYEGYGPSGVAVIVRTLTDNKNRTAGEVRHAFDKNGGNLGTAGSEPVPNTWVSIDDPEVKKSLRKMLDMLEDSDDVQDVFHNWENDDE